VTPEQAARIREAASAADTSRLLTRGGLERLQQMCARVLGDPAEDAGLDVAVDVRVGAGKLEPEGDMAVPACANVLERVVVLAPGTAAPQELLETVADDRVQQRLLAPEVVVESRCATPRPLGDRSGRDRPARRLAEQLGRLERTTRAGGPAIGDLLFTCQVYGEVFRVMRNIGGRVTPAVLRSWALLAKLGQARRGQPDEGPPHMVVLHHTDCGIKRLADYPGLLAKYFEIPVEELDTKAVRDPHAAVRIDVNIVRRTLPAELVVSGLVYDVDTGLVELVVPPATAYDQPRVA
jgi:hypothetical protein